MNCGKKFGTENIHFIGIRIYKIYLYNYVLFHMSDSSYAAKKERKFLFLKKKKKKKTNEAWNTL